MPAETNCRIGNIRLRNGATVRVLDSWTDQNIDACRRQFRQAANYTLDTESRMTGFFMVAWSTYGQGMGPTVTDHACIVEGSKRGYFDLPEFVKSVATQRVASKLGEGVLASEPETS